MTARNVIYSIQKRFKVGTMQTLMLWCVRNRLLDAYATDGLQRCF